MGGKRAKARRTKERKRLVDAGVLKQKPKKPVDPVRDLLLKGFDLYGRR